MLGTMDKLYIKAMLTRFDMQIFAAQLLYPLSADVFL
jgi:hypothetical protein